MSFPLIEESQQDGRPVEVYEFVYGVIGDHRYVYTNGVSDMEYPGGIAKAIPIDRDRYVSAGKTDKSTLRVRVSVRVELSDLFAAYPPTQPVYVTIYQRHFGDEDFIAVWHGRVLSMIKEGNENVFSCESTIISLKRPGLRRNYQYACPLLLYGPACRADMNAATYRSTVVAIDDGKVVLDADWWGDKQAKDFTGGMLRWLGASGGEYRTILRVEDDNSLVIVGPMRFIEVGDPIDVILGCNHLMDGCNLHNNINNFGGQPWIPLKNPVKYHPFW